MSASTPIDRRNPEPDRQRDRGSGKFQRQQHQLGGLASVNNLESTATASRITETFVGRNAIVELDDASLTGIATTATGAPMANALIDAASGSVGVSVSNLKTTATVGDGSGQSSNTRAYIDQNSNLSAGHVSLSATSDTTVSADVTSSEAGGLAASSSTDITAKAAHDTEVFVADNVDMTLTGALDMTATGTSTASPQSKGLGVAGGLSLGSATVVTELASDTRASIGEDGEITATSIDLDATGVHTATAAALNTGVAGLASISALDVTSKDTGSAEIRHRRARIRRHPGHDQDHNDLGRHRSRRRSAVQCQL